MKKRILSTLLGVALSISTLSGVAFADGTTAPKAWGPTPSVGQLKYHKEELAAFMHFGMNTFTDIEWGNGRENPKSFNPTALDAEQWVKVFDDMGFKRLVMVAKHHDGFNIWPTAYSEHSVKNSSWKDGKGDLLEEVSAACTKYDMNMGFYLSPWDAHEPSYGDGNPGDYNEFYMNQLKEVLGDTKYGNNGKFDEVWMDGAKGSGAENQHYKFDEWFELIKSYNEDTVIFSPYGTEVRWIGNENGIAGEPVWQRVDAQRIRDRYDKGLSDDNAYLNHGQADGPDWSVGEADVSIRAGWFYHENQKPKSVMQLADIYFKSVGRGVPLLLNVPADKRGLIHESDIERLQEFKAALDGTFTVDHATGATATATSVRGDSPKYNAQKALDGDYDTYWTMDDGETTGSVTIDLKNPQVIDVVEIQEYIPLGQRIAGFKVEVMSNGQWYEFGTGQTIGYKRLVRGNPVRAEKIRVSITDSQAVPLINNIGAYKADKAIELEGFAPLGMKSIDNTAFTKSNGWNAETGIGMNNTSMWTTTTNATAEFKFTGTKAYITATKDPNHGIMEILIDGVVIGDVDTYAAGRSAGTIVYETPELDHGEHTLKIRVKGERNASSKGNAIGVDGAYYLDNNGKGMFELSPSVVTIDEGKGATFTIDRIGGSVGEASVTFETAPGSAVHGRHYTDKIEKLTFANGETSKTVTAESIDNKEIGGDVFFFAELATPTDGAITGFNTSSKITIIDNDLPTDKEGLKTMLEKANNKNKSLYTADSWVTFVAERKAVQAIYDSNEVSQSDIDGAKRRMETAIIALVIKTKFNEEDPVVLSGSMETTVEAEWLERIGKAAIEDNKSASGGKLVGWIGHKEGDKGYTGSLDLWFDAPVAGKYEVDMHYFLGSPNTIKWSNEKIGDLAIKGSADLAFDGGNNGKFGMKTITIDIADAGVDHLRFYNDKGDGPNLDKFVVRCTEPESTIPFNKVRLTGEKDVKSGDSFDVTIKLDGIKDAVYSQDVIVEYDPNVFTFNNVEAITPNQIVSTEVDGDQIVEEVGYVRVLGVVLDGNGLAGNDIGIFKFNFTAKTQEERIESSSISASVDVGIGSTGEVVEVGTGTTLITIATEGEVVPGDKTELINKITIAKDIFEKAKVGTTPGEYSQESKNLLLAAIEAAEKVSSNATKAEINEEVETLVNAINEFETSVVKGIKGDVNDDSKVDIADIAIAAYNYQVISDVVTDWEKLKKIDFNGNSKIDMEDIIVIAKVILK